MAFIIQSNTPSSSTTQLYRDSQVNAATRVAIETKNSHCWDTPEILPVAAKALNDLSPESHTALFSGTGFDDSTGSDGIHFQQGSSGILTVGANGAIDISAQNVSSFYIIIWMARAAGFDTADFQGIAEIGQFNRGDSTWIIDTGEDGDSISFSAGGIGTVGSNAHDLVADEITPDGFSYETDGVDSILSKYKNGALSSKVDAVGSTGLISLPTQPLKIGTGGGGANAGFRLYRFVKEVIAVSSGLKIASGLNISERIAFDYAVNKSRFTF